MQQYAGHSAHPGRLGQLARRLARGIGSVAIGASLLVAQQAFASGTEQLKAFVAQVHSARGDFLLGDKGSVQPLQAGSARGQE